MSSWKQQALIESPVDSVWALLSDPGRYPEWAAEVIDVTGAPTEIAKGSTYTQRSHGPFGVPVTTTFEVEELDDLHEIKLRCQSSGYYSHWILTEARGQTFADLEIGIEPTGLMGHATSLITTKRQIREAAEQSLDGLRRALGPQAGSLGGETRE
jgi:uncharacterized protein YndB with AHSA1/START domain